MKLGQAKQIVKTYTELEGQYEEALEVIAKAEPVEEAVEEAVDESTETTEDESIETTEDE